jgi:hypothetical protein
MEPSAPIQLADPIETDVVIFSEESDSSDGEDETSSNDLSTPVPTPMAYNGIHFSVFSGFDSEGPLFYQRNGVRGASKEATDLFIRYNVIKGAGCASNPASTEKVLYEIVPLYEFFPLNNITFRENLSKIQHEILTPEMREALVYVFFVKNLII